MMRVISVVALSLALGACDQAPDRPKVKVEQSPVGGVLLSIEADTLIDGQRPTFTLVCRETEPPGFMVDLVRVPATPPPLRGMNASFAVDENRETSVEMAWGAQGSLWSVRMPHPSQDHSAADDRANAAKVRSLLAELARGSRLRMRSSGPHLPEAEVTWSVSSFGERLEAVRRCTGFNPSS